MLDFSRYQYRCGYIIDLDACKRYFEVGHQKSYAHVKPFVDHSNVEKGEKHKPSAEERRLELEESLEFELSQHFLDSFRNVRRAAPPDARVRLVLPHWWMREVPHENPKFEKRLHHGLFVPTASGIGSKFRKNGPTERDRERLQMFIDTTNGLVECELAKFTEADFTFETIPERALSGPLFNPEEVEELLAAGREFVELYGLTPREFLKTYY